MKYLKGLSILTASLIVLMSCSDDKETFKKKVSTVQGTVEGFSDESDTIAWLGIPYAKPPVGELRWKAPQDPESWSSTLSTKKFGSACTQYGYSSISKDIYPGTLYGSEDCLFLNIWRPESTKKGLAVFFWVHGGFNDVGTAAEEQFYGAKLASKGNMVVVTINYRLGPFGWFSHPSLRENSDQKDDSGNYGTLDIIKALEWVRDNIEKFGGDPSRVTLAGQSAGAADVFSLIVSPLAEGLFHRAIAQSGVLRTVSSAAGDAAADVIVQKFISKDGTAAVGDSTAAYLRGKSAEDIINSYTMSTLGSLTDEECPQLFEDGHVIPVDASSALSSGNYANKVPVIIGSTTHEAKAFLSGYSEIMKNEDSFSNLFGYIVLFMDPEAEEPVVDLSQYLGIDIEVYDLIGTYWSKRQKIVRQDWAARAMAKNQDNVYVYEFSWDEEPEPLDILFGAAHGIDIGFLFRTFDKYSIFNKAWNSKNRAGRLELSSNMIKYWSTFVKTGDPNADSLPEWAPWTETGPSYIYLDTEITTGTEVYTLDALETEMKESSVYTGLDANTAGLVDRYTGFTE